MGEFLWPRLYIYRLGDSCDPDIDNDDILNEVDNCPEKSNKDQKDSDEDGVGDVCDNCLNGANPDQVDDNQNFIGDVCEIGIKQKCIL